MTILVAPSILSANLLNLGQDLLAMEESGADWHHIDVMDGHFVPNLTFGLPLIASLKSCVKIPLDVHIMISNPDMVALEYVDAGANWLSFHIEASVHPYRLIQAIQNKGAKAGIAVNPGTPIETVFPLLEILDYVLIMSVNPGFGGQVFIPSAIHKIARVKQELEHLGRRDDVIIQVDGGINLQTGRQVIDAGASSLVAGTFLYKNSNRSLAIRQLRELKR